VFAQDGGAPRRSFTEREVPRGQYHIYARDYPGEDPPFVLMHGFPDNSSLYDRLVPELAARRVIVFDYLGWESRTSRRTTPTPSPTSRETSTR
jgi:pimeloyl-ACP methyl ester carboxylesterase